MAEIRMTTAQARAAGIDLTGAKKAKVRTTRHEASGPYLTACRTCGEQFTSMAAEDHHIDDTTHRTFAVVLERNT